MSEIKVKIPPKTMEMILLGEAPEGMIEKSAIENTIRVNHDSVKFFTDPGKIELMFKGIVVGIIDFGVRMTPGDTATVTNIQGSNLFRLDL